MLRWPGRLSYVHKIRLEEVKKTQKCDMFSTGFLYHDIREKRIYFELGIYFLFLQNIPTFKAFLIVLFNSM